MILSCFILQATLRRFSGEEKYMIAKQTERLPISFYFCKHSTIKKEAVPPLEHVALTTPEHPCFAEYQ